MNTLRLFALTLCSPLSVVIGIVGVVLLSIAGKQSDPLQDLPRGAKVYDQATGEYITREQAIVRCRQRRAA